MLHTTSRQGRKNLLRTQRFQMLQDGQVGIHPSFHTVLRTGFFCPVQAPRRDPACNAFVPANIGEVVDS